MLSSRLDRLGSRMEIRENKKSLDRQGISACYVWWSLGGCPNPERTCCQSPFRGLIFAEQGKEYVKLGKELESLGVEFLGPEEVKKKMEIAKKSSGLYTPYVDLPTSTNVTWSSFRNKFVKNGVTYEVQHLAAELNSLSSRLKETGGLLLQSSYSWQAGVMNLAKTVGYEAASGID